MFNSARNVARMAAPTGAANNDLNDNWLRRINDTATTGDSKDAHSQLQSVLDYFNRSSVQQAKPIDWQGFKERIHTAGVVDKIQGKYEKFMKSEYTVDAAVSRCGTSTEKLQALDVAMQYNFMLYFVHYAGHLDQLETMRNIGDLQQMSLLEMVKLMPGAEELSATNQEIGNLAPEDYNEDGVFTRVCT